MYIYIYIYIYTHTYIYIYIERERDVYIIPRLEAGELKSHPPIGARAGYGQCSN